MYSLVILRRGAKFQISNFKFQESKIKNQKKSNHMQKTKLYAQARASPHTHLHADVKSSLITLRAPFVYQKRLPGVRAGIRAKQKEAEKRNKTQD